MQTFVLLFRCKDRKGIVAKVSDFIFRQGGNIITADQYTTDPANGDFFMRAEFSIEAAAPAKDQLESGLAVIAAEFSAQAKVYDKNTRLRMGIMVSRPGHCLLNLLYLWKSGDLAVDIPFVASNYSGHKELAEQFKVPFHYLAANAKERKESELLALASKETDFLVLARYMLVLSGDFLKNYARDIINIHHGFLPSFKGGGPYRQALDKGVKVIGATAHFVTEELDGGQIISQAVEYVSHKDDLKSLVAKGRHLENRALSDALSSYVDYRVIKQENKSIVF